MNKRRGSGEGSIFEERPGKWVASITVGYEFRAGKRVRVRKKFSAPTRGEVSEKLKSALKAQQDGLNIAPQKQTVAHFLNYWLDHVVPAGAKPKTMSFYRYIATTHLIPSIGKIQLQKLTAQHVQTLINEKLSCTKQARNKPRKKKLPAEQQEEPATDAVRLQTSATPWSTGLLSPRSVRHIHRTLCTALEVAVKHEAVQRNVAMLVDPPRIPKSQMKFLTVDQARDVLAAATGDPLYALYATILSLGLRLGEALGLTWSDIDFKNSRIYVRSSLQRVNGKLTLLEPKTEGSTRTIDLPAVTIAALRENQIRQSQIREWAGSAWTGNKWNLVFTSPNGNPLDERGVLRRFQGKILRRAGVPKMRIHDLRHSAVAILMAQGVDARSISELLGHSSVAFTLQVYGHLMEETKRETASKMDSALAPKKPVTPSLAPSDASGRVM